MDSEETLLALLGERSVRSCVDQGVTLDGGPMEGAPVLEPLEHSVLEKTLCGRPMEGMTVLEPLEHSVLEMALDGELIVDLSVLEPLEHSVLEVARNGGPMAGISVLEPLEHSVPEVTLVWGDYLLIKMTVSDPLEHSGLGVTVHVYMDSLWMAPWDAGRTLKNNYRHGMAIWRDVLCCVVRLSRMLVLPATGYLRSFGGIGMTCIIDLNAGESTVDMLGDDTQTDFPRPQFPPGGGGCCRQPWSP